MKKLLIASSFVFTIVFAFVFSSFAFADSDFKLDWKKEVNPSECGKVGKPVINVTQAVVNDADSGQAGNYWAFDNYKRHIQVWTRPEGSYCALVSYEGAFDAQAGQVSPGNTGILTGNEDGQLHGGRRATIIGTLKTVPSWPTDGSVGLTDYQCDLSGNCPGFVSWPGQYFESGFSYSDDWWGWIYRAEENGTWINAITGNLGDVL